MLLYRSVNGEEKHTSVHIFFILLLLYKLYFEL